MTTRYEMRRAVNVAKQQLRQQDRKYDKREQIDAVCRRLEEAWWHANHVRIVVNFTSGWYRFPNPASPTGVRQARETEVLTIIKRLEAKAADLVNPDEENA